MPGYGQPSLQSSSTLPASQIPAAVALPFTYATAGLLQGEIKVTATVPTLSAGGPPLTIPVIKMTLFYALTDISTYDLDSIFALPANIVGKQTITVPALATTVQFDVTGLAPGAGYFFRCAAST